jgi:hypothetical protein
VNWNTSSTGGTLTASTSGVFAGVLIYQACDSHQDLVTNTLGASDTSWISGGIYMPCGLLHLLGGTTVATVSGSTAKVEANQFLLDGGGKLNITGAGGAPTAANVNLMQ